MQGDVFWITIGFFTVSLLLICIGWGKVEGRVGVALIWLGALIMLGLIFVHIWLGVAIE